MNVLFSIHKMQFFVFVECLEGLERLSQFVNYFLGCLKGDKGG